MVYLPAKLCSLWGKIWYLYKCINKKKHDAYMGVKVGFETLNQLNMGYMFDDSKCVHEEALGFHQDWKTSTPKTGIEPPKAKL